MYGWLFAKGKGITGLLGVLVILFFTIPAAKAGDGFEEWARKERQEFQEYKDKRDKEFLDFLKKEWRDFQVFKGLARDKTPKPVKIPVARKTRPKVPSTPSPGKVKKKKPIPLPDVTISKEPDFSAPPAPLAAKKGKRLTITFFETPLTVYYDERIKTDPGNRVNKETISAFWDTLSRADYEDLLARTAYYKDEMNLNDWGYCLLINEIGEGIYHKGEENQKNLFVWFMLTKAGYETRIGYNKESIYLLLPSTTVLYSTPNFEIDHKKFYLVTFNETKKRTGSLYTYDGKYPGADRLISLKMTASPNIKNAVVNRELRFTYADREYVIPVEYNKNTIDYFNTFPQTDLEVYFDSSMSPEAGYSLLNGLRPIIEEKSEREAVNILLRFVQTAFDYKTDGEQFGKEKYFFREETLFYPFSDCEDRSILFAYLVRKLTGLEVVGLDFPGHVATAVRFSGDMEGDHIIYKGRKYLICDPTYIHADAGMRMPQFKGVEPKIIRISPHIY